MLGGDEVAVYLFFPRMYRPDKETNFPGKEDGQPHALLRNWTDQILLPALFRHVPATSRQHFPTSWEHARRKAEAHYIEGHARFDGEAQMAPQARTLHYSIPGSRLANIWRDITQ